MIKLGVLAGDGRYYERDLSPGAYYEAADSGVAAGGAAAAAGLRDAVTAAETDNLLAGRSADGGRELVRPHPKRKQGCELHAAPDKSVSALFAAAPLAVAWAIVAASEAALRLALRQAEAECGVTRRGKAGLVRELGKLVFVIYIHFTSRAGDPQLHHHVVVANLVLRPDGTWGAHHNRLLYKAQKRLTATYNRALRDNLVSLGIDARLENGRCVVAGVPKSLCEAFSTRRKEVVSAKGEFHPKDREAAQKAAWATRGRKLKTTEAELRARWRAVAKAHGYDPAASVLRTPTADQIEAVRAAAEAAYPGPGRVGPTADPTPAASRPATARQPAAEVTKDLQREQRARTPNEPRPASAVPPRTPPVKQPEGQPRPQKTAPAGGPTAGNNRRPESATAAREARNDRIPEPTPLARAAAAAADPDLPGRRSPERLARQALKRAVADLARTFAHFGPDQIEARAIEVLKRWEKAGVGRERETAPALADALRDLRDRPKGYGLVPLPNAAGYATARQWKLEQAVARDLRRLAHGRAREASRPSAVLRGLTRADLTPDQQGAVTGVVCSPSRLSLVDGTGRAGKTAVAQEVCEAFARAGREVYAVAGTARGADALVEDTATRPLSVTGFNLLTRRPGLVETWKLVFRAVEGKRFKSPARLARYAEAVHRRLKTPPVPLGRNSVVVVDDAHRVPTADLAPLLKRAREAGAKVVLVGDSTGPLPARPAGAFAHAARTRPAATLTPPVPAADPAVREAVRRLAGGRGASAAKALRDGGVLRATDRPRADLLAEYRRGGHLERPADTVVLTASEREAGAVNRAVQRLRRAAGRLGTGALGDGCRVYVGDRVQVTRSYRKAGVAAHALGTLVAVGPTRHRVRLDDGRKVAVPAADSPLRPAYALGPTAAAGHAFDRAFVLLAPHRPGAGRPARLPNRGQALAMFAQVSGRATAFARTRDVADGRLAAALNRDRRPGMAVDAAEAARRRAEATPSRPDRTQQVGY